MGRFSRGTARAPTSSKTLPSLPPVRATGLVAAGGTLGALARAAQNALLPVEPGTFPWSTFAENLAGAFLLGALITVLLKRGKGSTWAHPLLGTGLLGAYTTYATVGLELHLLVRDGHPALAAFYLWTTALAGLLACGAGIFLARRFTGGGR